jgi:hypothetical protein
MWSYHWRGVTARVGYLQPVRLGCGGWVVQVAGNGPYARGLIARV